MIGIYCRVSTEEQGDNYSWKRQHDDGIAFAEQKGELPEIYKEQISGTKADRPAFNKLAEDIINKKITSVWVKAIDRIARDTIISLSFFKILIDNKALLYVDGVAYDLKDNSNLFLAQMLSVVAEYDRNKIIERTTAGKHKQIDLGERRYSCLYGYKAIEDINHLENGGKKVKKITHKWVIDEAEARVIRYIFKLASEYGYSSYKIYNRLNDKEFKIRNLKYINCNAVVRIITRLEYTGRTYNTKKEIIESKIYEPIVDIDTFKKANEVINTSKNKNTERLSIKHFCSGLIKCSKCGAGYYYKTTKAGNTGIEYKAYSHRVHRTCSQNPKSMVYDVIDKIFDDFYINLLMDKPTLDRYLKNIEKEIDYSTFESDIRFYDEEIEKQEKRLVNLEDLMIDKGKTERLLKRSDEIELEIKKYKALKKSKMEELNINAKKRSEVLLAFGMDKLNAFRSADQQEKRLLLNEVIERVSIEGFKISIEVITGDLFEINYNQEKKKYKELRLKERELESIVDEYIDNPNLLSELNNYVQQHEKEIIENVEEKLKGKIKD